MKFSGKLMVFCLTILALVFILPLNARASVPTAEVEVQPLIAGYTIATPTFMCKFKANLDNPADSAFGVDSNTVLFRFRKQPSGPWITIFDGSLYEEEGESTLASGYTMSKSSTVDAIGNIIEVIYTFGWGTADSLLNDSTYRYSLSGSYIYDFTDWTVSASGNFKVGQLKPDSVGEIITTVTPLLSDTVPPKPLFNLRFRIKNTYASFRPFAVGVPDDSLRFVVYNQSSGDSIVIFDDGTLADGFRMYKKPYTNPSTGGDTAVDYFFAWDTTTDQASPLVNGEYRCVAKGAYEFYLYNSTMLDTFPIDTATFTVYSSSPTPEESLASITIEAPSPIPGIASSKPSFKAAFRLNSLVAEYGVNVPDSTLRFVIFDSTGDSTVIFKEDSLTEGFQMTKQGYDTTFPGADSMDVFFRWNPTDPADSLVDGPYYCKIQGGYDVGWILYSDDSISFDVFGTAPQITILGEGYINPKGDLDFFLRSFGTAFGNFLDTTHFAIDFYLVNLPNTSSEERRYIKTLLNDGANREIVIGSVEAETVKVGANLNLTDGVGLDVFMYDGTTPNRAVYVNSSDSVAAYPESLSCRDRIYNRCGLKHKRFIVDALPPQITMLDSTDKAWKFYVYDAGSGVNDNSVVVKINGTKVTGDTLVQYDENTDILTYYPMNLGALLSITATDKVENRGSYSTYVQSGRLIIRDVHSYPNPFNPIKGETAKITFKSNRGDNPDAADAEMSAEVYDLAGKHIATLLEQNADGELIWNGRTDSGELVANGAYFCYVKIKDLQDLKIENYVLKIAVVKKN